MPKGVVKKAARRKRGTRAARPREASRTGSRSDGPDVRRAAARRPPVKRTRENQATLRARAARILAALRELYPDATTALHHRSALELLVATVLSAQCTDERVNMVMPELMRRYPDAAALAAARQEDLEAMIKSTGFFRSKAKSLRGIAQVLCERHGGRVPDTMEALLELPGVARKTANCVLGTWFGKNEGIVVDTHVGRAALRLRLLTTARNDKDAVKIENDLMQLFPRESWTFLSHALIWHGRRVCMARKPRCDRCALAGDCPSAGGYEPGIVSASGSSALSTSVTVPDTKSRTPQ